MSNILKVISPKKLMAIATLGVSAGWIGMKAISQPQLSGSIDLASVSQSAKPSLEKLPEFSMMKAKHLSLLQVKLSVPENIPLDGSDQVEIHGTIQMNQNITTDIKVQWLLPEDVQVSNGQIESVISNALPGKTYDVVLLVSGFNKTEKKIITLKASIEKDGATFGNTSLISSRPEDSMEYIAQDMSEAAFEIDTAPREGKIFK